MAIDNRRILSNTLFLYFRMFWVMGASILSSGMMLRALGKVDYGLYAVLGGIVAMFSFLNGSLSGAASRHITYELGQGRLDRVNEIFNVSLAVFLGLSLVIVALSETVGLWYFYNKMQIPTDRVRASFWVFQISVANVPIMLSQIPYNAVLVARENMKIYAYVSIADAIIKVVTAYMLFIFNFDRLLMLSLFNFIWSLITISFYRIYCIHHYSETRLRVCRDKYLYKMIFQYAGSDLIGNLSCLAQGQGLNLLLNSFFGPTVNAARGIAYGLQGLTTQFSSNFMTAVIPQIIKSFAQKDLDGMWTLVRRSSCFSFYLVLLLALPAWLEADYILRLWLGDYPDHTLSFFCLIVVICLIQTIKMPFVKVIHANGKIFMANCIGGTILCAAFPIAYFGLKLGGEPEVVFIATIITMVASVVSDWFVLHHYVPYKIAPYVLKVYGRCVLVTLVSLAFSVVLHSKFMSPSLVRVLLTGLTTTFSVTITAFFLGMESSDRRQLISFVLSKIEKVVQR